MTFAKGARLLSHLAALACFSALITNNQFTWPWSVAGLGLILASIYFLLAERPVALSARFWRGASVLFCLIFLIDLRLSGALLAACMHFLVYLMAYRLFHLEKSRDHLQLYLISFLQLLAAAGAGSGFGYALSFVLSAALLIWGLVVQHLTAEEESRRPPVPARSFRSVIPFHLMISIHLLSVGVLLPTLLIFFLLPRLGIGFLQQDQTSAQKISGFSERVNLGSMGPVKRDLSLVMRVLPSEGEKGAPLYLRGMSFDAYDGKAWKNTLSRRVFIPKSFDRTFEIGRPTSSSFQRTILLEPLDTNVLFTVGAPEAVRGSFASLLRDRSGTLYLAFSPTQRTEYDLTAAAERLSEADRSATEIDYPFDIRQVYLSAEVSPRIVALAHQIADPFPTIYQKVQAIERHLRTQYTYSLEVAPSPRPPLEEFLFFQKKGYCEYYASAMVMMLRSVGIASRLVTGFLPGEWNEFGKYYLVRQSDAHAWVEVYFPGGRWLPFDPTPSVAQPGGPLLTALSAYTDWMRLRWERYIVRYSLRDQFALLEGTRDQVGRFSDRLGEWVALFKRSARRIPPAAPALAAAALLILLMIARWRRGETRWRRGGRSSKQGATLLYERMLRLLAKQGVRKREEQTPLEFAEAVARGGGPSIDAVRMLTGLYCEARFGGRAFSAEDLKRAEALFARIKKGG